MTQKLSEITKDRGENSINIINKINTIEGQGNDSVEKGEDKKENKIQLINNIFIQEENNDLLTRNMILKKLYRKHKNIRSISNNNKSNSYIKNKSSNVITENTIAKKTINLSHNKYTRNKPVINEMLKAANNTKNDSYIQNISSSLQKTSSLINKINLSLGANTINKLINQNKTHKEYWLNWYMYLLMCHIYKQWCNMNYHLHYRINICLFLLTQLNHHKNHKES